MTLLETSFGRPKSDLKTVALNRILQCELSANQTYSSVLDKRSDSQFALDIFRFAQDHLKATHQLQMVLTALGITPIDHPGIWGQWTEGVESASQVVGEIADLNALKQEEDTLIDACQLALDVLPAEKLASDLIAGTLIPQAEARRDWIKAAMSRSRLLSAAS